MEDALVFEESGKPHVFTGHIPEAWSQGRACFGGLLLAQIARLGERVVSDGRPLRSMNVTYVAPVGPGPIEIEMKVLREGRSVSHVHGTIFQNGKPAVASMLAYATARPGSIEVPPSRLPDVPPAEEGNQMPYNPPLTPQFSQHWDYRWTVDGLPFSGGDHAHVMGWIRPFVPTPVDASLVLALLDAYPPPIWSKATGIFAASSLSSHYQIREIPQHADNPNPWFFYDGPAVAVGDGHSDVQARLWHEDGTLVALGIQHFVDFSDRLKTS